MLLSVDIRTINACVTKLQFARGSDWENCLVLVAASAPRSIDAIFEGAREGVAAEAFFNIAELGINGAFAGFRVSAAQSDSMIEMASEFASAAEKYDLASFICAAERISGCGRLFSPEPDFMELGIINRWCSFGPVRFWNRGGGDPEKNLISALDKNPKYLGRLPGVPAVETGWAKPIPHWSGMPVKLG